MNKVFRFLCVMIMAALLPVGAQATRYYVALNAAGTGASWDAPMPLANAISNAVAGDEIWIQGYDTLGGVHVYRVPDANGFTVKSGVKIYGGFAGTETSIDDREIVESKAYRMKYRTVISGDVSGNDVVDATNLIFPANPLRKDNATHVLTLDLSRASGSNQNSLPTVINGVTIARGHATGGVDEAGGHGGGILVTAASSQDIVSYSIERCFFIANYATRGGALYVEPDCEGTVSLSGFFNNAAGERSGMENSGGAIWLDGGGTVVNTAVFNNANGGIMLQGSGARVLNSTVTRNTGAGIDGSGHDVENTVENTVVWGNSLLSMSDASRPTFRHSAYPEANPGGTDSNGNGNVYLADKNNEAQGPHFSAPSLKIGFDTDYDMTTQLYPLWTWEPVEATPLVDAGDDTYYYTDQTNLTTAFGSLDLGLNPRHAGARIDIGAFEFQPVAAGRIRYVRPQAHGTGDGSSWVNASADIQQMIDYLADNNPQGLPGEVWVAAGEYEPRAQLITGTAYSASFRMRDGISVYGGFSNDSPEATKAGRAKGTMPWQYDNETILSAANYSHSNLSFNTSTNRWSTQSDSRHVVWFAPLGQDAPAFSRVTVLDGFTIRGGYAQGNTGLTDFLTDRGAGVYIDGENAYLQNCVVKENNATGDGGGVYLKEGRVQGSLIYNNNAGGNGGAVYVSDRGLVHRSMLTNNSARNGAGVYLHNVPADTDDHPEYLILSTCVVSNNTAIGNGAVYCDGGGVLLQNTITNNWTPTSTDLTDPNASQTGGLYIDTYALVANSVIWNNRIGGGTTPAAGTNVPMFARNQSAQTVRFLYNAISGTDNAVWNSTLQEQTLKLVDTNSGTEGSNTAIGPRFEIDTNTTGSTNIKNNPEDIEINKIGVQSGWNAADGTAIDYYWKPRHGSNLWARGMAIGQLPDEVVLAPEIDIEGELFAQKPGVGAFHVEGSEIVPALEDGNTLVVYVDAECTEPEHKGTSWATAYRSLNDAIKFFAGLTNGSMIKTGDQAKPETEVTSGHKFEIRVLEGNLWPRYAFVNDDPKTATLDILAMQSGKPLRIVGGYHRNDAGSTSVVRDPLTYRSQLNGNSSGSQLEDGLYHVVTVEPGAIVELDGFHVINGYAAGAASLQYGAGMLVRDGADVTLTNCIFENNTAAMGAAIDARNATLTMRNCVVNNNTNTSSSEQLINCPDLTMHHVSIVNNVGAAPENTSNAYSTSFAAGNVSDKETGATYGMNNTITLATTGADGAKNFANPTNKQGATLGFDTYLGGYSSFRPLTSSEASATNIINKGGAKTIETDIMGNERDLGGAADLGAYEADLPRAGKVIYVRSYNQEWRAGEELDGNPSLRDGGDGSSWDTAINGNVICNVHIDIDENFYATAGNDNYILSTEDNYSGTYGFDTDFYADFWDTDDNSYGDSGWNIIKNDRTEQYVSGLQYAVEKAAEMNKSLRPDEDSVEVWVGAGIYTDYKGFVIRDKVRVFGGFPKSGVPGESDRHPLISQYIPANEADVNLEKTDYETILQIRKETPVTWNGYTGTPTSIVTNLGNTVRRRYVLFQPDVCLPTWAPSQQEGGTGGRDNKYRYPGSGSDMIDNDTYQEYTGAMWDGFTVRHGYINQYHSNRDGGAGVRVFRGVTLQNLIIANNCNRNTKDTNTEGRNRGGGLYMDGLNSRINNSFILNNYIGTAGQSMGGGAYMIVGTGYNLVVANNYSSHRGGGIFMESATFFNNTIAYNYAPNPGADSSDEGGSGLFQYAENNMTRPSNLELYNCIFYGNYGVSVSSNTPATFNEAYNCYVQGTVYTRITNKFPESNGNQRGQNLANPFEAGSQAQSTNNYRLLYTNYCVNGGTEEVDGKVLNLPSTDMDYTNRIKDCAIDIGAYELDNEENIKYTLTGTQGNYVGTYYVSQNGVGSRSGENAANAACAMKLQDILTDAGEEVKNGTLASAVVRLAGYEADNAGASFVYHANTLADKNNPQSYTFVVPAGVTLEGGYYEGTTTNGNYNNDGWDDERVSDDHVRNVMRFRTVLSAVAVPTQGSTIAQEVNGYHVVTFGGGDGTAALDKPAVIDGLWLTDGSATSMAGAGSADTRGGGAIVPAGAHVRNCVVENCAAIEGGGLYLLPGATVSGTAVLRCTASYGGGIFADGTNAADDSRAHIISCTVADNEAEVSGGGISMEEGAAMAVNTVVWGNDAQADKNVSGVTHERFADKKLADVFGDVNEGSYYPFNDCFVETQELPSDFENASMVSDSTVYFDTSDHYRTLKEFSPLIKHGVKAAYHDKLVSVFGVAPADIQNIARSQEFERTDAGAFAYAGGVLPTALFTRIFVSPTSNVKLADGADINNYLGRSFYTSFTTLDDALNYIKTMRDAGKNNHFEILMAAGTYKPTTARTTAATGVTHDQRLYSFVVPHNVSIYGGFSGTELISSDNVTSIELADGSTKDFTADDPINDILADRAFSDFNQNGIEEAWELANQTILSGNINVSATASNVYHVVYSDATGVSDPKPVTLDGLTVMNGETSNVLSEVSQSNEQGRGGGIYSNGVGYTLSRCRLMNNFGVRGGAVFVRDARLSIVGSIFAGNGWTKEMTEPEIAVSTQPARGGAVFVSGLTTEADLYAVNTLFVNNETVGQGGAIGTNYAEGITGNYDPLIDLMNCTFARNKAATNAVIYNHNGKSQLTNTLIWGNESENYNDQTDAAHMTISHSASDYNYGEVFGTGSNVLLSADNSATNGPRFTNPATVAGVSGNDATNLWNPAAISVATDAGAGTLQLDGTYDPKTYEVWFGQDKGMTDDYQSQYMGTADYARYSGPTDDNNNPAPKPIDIGVYEYQYISNFSTMLEIYVDTVQAGDGSGNSWENATADLRGAIVGASNPTQETGARTVYVRDGDYMLPRASAGSVFVLNMSGSDLSDSLIVKGSCTGVGDAQDFDRQTVLRDHPQATSAQTTLLSVNANSKDVVIEGFSFINKTTGTTDTDRGQGVVANAHDGGSLRMRNCAFRMNQGTGMTVTNSDFSSNGPVLIYNTLFADGGTGLAGNGKTTVVNATFANNNTTDFSVSEGHTLAGIYNSVAWNNKEQNLNYVGGGAEQIPGNGNSSISVDEGADPAENNADIHDGPNFVDPLNADKELRDYHIRPSLTLLNAGENDTYEEKVRTDPADDVDLGSGSRLVDGQIDVGAYEYEAPLRPIVYVKAGVVAADADGSSWDKPLADLQGAVDLVGIYAHNNEGKTGYAFVHNNVDGQPLRLSLDNVKVYGGMSDETSTTVVSQDANGVWQGVDAKVNELLAARKGLLESAGHTELSSVTVDVFESKDSYNAVADGFIVNGQATVNRGTLSTSVVCGDVKMTRTEGTGKGLLYNTLVYDGVSGGVKAVNVTAAGQISEAADGSANNRSGVSETNAYVTDDDWKYQLMETSADIDGGTDADATEACIEMVGHRRDIAGNERVRQTVDNGCFETWNIDYDGAEVIGDDYPRGKSVVYIRAGNELPLNRDYAADAPFCPGVLLLEHRAGLRGNGKNVGLSHVIMERNVPAGGIDMTGVPFSIIDFEKSSGDGLAVKYYDGNARAAYDYAFDGTNGKAWSEDISEELPTINTHRSGLLLDNSEGTAYATVRFIGQGKNVYTEGSGMSAAKNVTLSHFNFSEPWTSPTEQSDRFTHKENMSWNLFGSPYLCAMNYSDMEYGRVIYGYSDDKYLTVNTSDDDIWPQGYIPAGDAVFTQTATLNSGGETFAVKWSDAKTGDAYKGMADLQVAIAGGGTRADSAAAYDVLQLSAVDAAGSRSDFDMSADGVKWMAAGAPQIYATRGGARYSLLSAVSRDGEVGVGLTLPSVGTYTIGIPEDCAAEGYETVLLKDAATGRTVDLLEDAYDFSADAAGDVAGRFTISFNRTGTDRFSSGISISSPAPATVAVSGLERGDVVRVYSASGVMAAQTVASAQSVRMAVRLSGIAVVEVVRGGKTVKAGKVRVN